MAGGGILSAPRALEGCFVFSLLSLLAFTLQAAVHVVV